MQSGWTRNKWHDRQPFWNLLRIPTSRFKTLSVLLALAAIFSLRLVSAPQGGATDNNLSTVLAKMDAAAARFTNATGNLDYTKVTVIVNDESTEKGTIAFERSKGKTRVMLAFREPAEKYVLFEGNRISMYRPKIAEVEEYELAQRSGLVEQFLLLGFGTAGSELKKSYQVTLGKPETLNGQPTVHLELVPQSNQLSAQLKKIELWISPDTWQPVQQKFFEPSGDYLVARYSNLKLNAKISSKQFKLPLKGKVKTVRPQRAG